MLTSREERKPVLESDSPKDDLRWLVQVMKNPKTLPWNEEMKLKFRDATELLAKVENGSHRERKNALALLGRLHGITICNLCLCLGTTPSTVGRNWKKFKESGTAGVFQERPLRAPKANDQKIKAAVFSMIHSPPSEHGINRTSWKRVSAKLR